MAEPYLIFPENRDYLIGLREEPVMRSRNLVLAIVLALSAAFSAVSAVILWAFRDTEPVLMTLFAGILALETLITLAFILWFWGRYQGERRAGREGTRLEGHITSVKTLRGGRGSPRLMMDYEYSAPDGTLQTGRHTVPMHWLNGRSEPQVNDSLILLHAGGRAHIVL